jgi:hypothetical protein
MSDIFYERQAKGNPKLKTEKGKRKLKKDWIAEITTLLGKEVVGLDKCTMKTLEHLLEAIKSA